MLGCRLKKLEGNHAMDLVLQTKVLLRSLAEHKPVLDPIANMPKLNKRQQKKPRGHVSLIGEV
jgi:hypothetical protein